MLYISIALVLIALLWAKYPPKLTLNVVYTPQYPEPVTDNVPLANAEDEKEPTPQEKQAKILSDMAALVNQAMFGEEIV